MSSKSGQSQLHLLASISHLLKNSFAEKYTNSPFLTRSKNLTLLCSVELLVLTSLKRNSTFMTMMMITVNYISPPISINSIQVEILTRKRGVRLFIPPTSWTGSGQRKLSRKLQSPNPNESGAWSKSSPNNLLFYYCALLSLRTEWVVCNFPIFEVTSTAVQQLKQWLQLWRAKPGRWRIS